MDFPEYEDLSVTVGGRQSSYQVNIFPNPSQALGATAGLLESQSFIARLAFRNSTPTQFDIAGVTATAYITANQDQDYTPVLLGSGSLSDSGQLGGGTVDQVEFTINKDNIPGDLGAYPKTQAGNAKIYFILEDATGYLEFYEGVNVYDEAFGGTGGSSPNVIQVRKNNLGVVLDTLDTPPGSPATNDAYLVGTSPTGAWASNADNLAVWNGGAWIFTAPQEGDFLFDLNEDVQKRYISSWIIAEGAPFTDAQPLIKNDADNTKTISFDAAAITTATNRNITMPNTDVNLGDIATNNAKVSNATHTGDASGDTALTLQPAAITGKTSATPESGDKFLFSDTSDSGNLKECDFDDIGGGGGGGGGILPTAGNDVTIDDIDSPYAITAGNISDGSLIIIDSASSGEVIVEIDPALLARDTKINLVNNSSYKGTLEVDDTVTDTINNLVPNIVFWNGDGILTITGDSTTNCYVIAGG